MPLTVKKHRRRKPVRHTNKKKVRKNHYKVKKCEIGLLNRTWDDKKTVRKNMMDMGLSYDANEAVKTKRRKPQKVPPPKIEVAEQLERVAKAPKEKTFKYPKPLAIYYTYLIKKYGDNYKEMAKDRKNVYQETWKQIRSKVVQFRKLEQYRKFTSG